ncbi:nucleotidyltransferase family protein [Brenneria uluponensis]|uniref:nucleotidyltransferase family protein n=1 Tax=Brenneria uluponensis TaxID=3057057 RepID=UPI0028E47384|nr:nucleotidyltransferase family protein [Brenneria ulupoensis]
MKFNKEILGFYDYFNKYLIAGSEVTLPVINDSNWEELYSNKLLYAWLDIWRQTNILTPWAKKRLEIYKQKELLHEKILEKLTSRCLPGSLIKLKGESFRSLYPKGFQRESRDVDVLYKNEHDFISAHEYLVSLGFREMFVWLRKTRNGMAGSAKFRLKNNEGERALDDIYVEIHVNAFPVSNFSSLYFDQLSGLTEVTRLVLLSIAEFTFRDGVAKKFTLRDIIDVTLSFNLLSESEWSSLLVLLKQAKLEAPVLLLSDFWKAEIYEPMPALLAWLQQQCSSARWDGDYSIIENQSWPYQQQYGMTREQFDEVVKFHGLLYDSPRQITKTYSTEEMTLWMNKGLPVVAKYIERCGCVTIKESYQICDRFIY